MKMTVCKLLTFAAAGLTPPVWALSTQEGLAINVERLPVVEALSQLSSQAGIQISYFNGQSGNVLLGPLNGYYTAEDAVAELLFTSDLTYAKANKNTFAVWRRQIAQIDAQALAPSLVRMQLASTAETTQVAAASGPEDDRSMRALEEVVVTAQKRQESIQDVPMSVTALSGDELDKRDINSLLDLSFSVPSLSVAEMGPGRQLISIRGISSLRGGSPLVGMYLDEAPLSTTQSLWSTGPDVRALDLERVEVLKGPQGTLFGEGAAGGVIRFITKDPDLTRAGGQVATEFYDVRDGDWGQEITGVANIPVSDSFGLRIAAKYENVAGWIDQPSVGKENVNDSEVKHARVKALFVPTDSVRLKAMAEIHRNDGGATNVVNQVPLEESDFREATDINAPTHYYDDYDIYNLTATFDLGFAELLSSTSRGEFDDNQRESQISLERPAARLEVLKPENSWLHRSFFSQEIRLTSSTSGPFGWTVGASYKDLKSVSYSGDGLLVRLFGDTPSPLIVTLDPNIRTAGASESMAGFTDVSYKIGERVTVGGGLRYFRNELESNNNPPISAEFDKLTYRGYVRFKASETANIYASAGTGFRSGGVNSAAVRDRGAPAGHEPEETIFYELGTKLDLMGGRLRVDGAVFYGEYQGMLEDINVTSPVDGLPLQYTGNGQDAEIRGIELALDWAMTERLTLGLSGDLTDTEVTYIDPRAPAPTFLLGDRINYVPEYTLSALANYSFQWSNGVPAYVQLSANQKGKSYETVRSRYGGLILADQAVAPEVTFLNLIIGGELQGWNWSVFGRNITDERGIVNASVTGSTAQARPRSFGVGLSKSF